MRELKPHERFNGNINLKKAGAAIPYSEEDIREIIRCKEDIIYFTENYVKIISIDDGKVPFTLYPYQREMLKAYKDNQQVICLTCRQAGKCVTGNTRVSVLSPAGTRFEISIEEFFNDLLRNQESRVRRGSNCESNQTLSVLSEEFRWGSLDHSESGGEEDDMAGTLAECEVSSKKFTDSLDARGWSIRGPHGWAPLIYIHRTVPYRVWHVEFENNRHVKCADTHIFIGTFGSEIYAKNLYPGLIVKSEEGFTKVRSVRETSEEVPMFDPEIHTNFVPHYFSNGILSHNTTTAAAFLLYQMLFTTDISIGILANKAATAQEILNRLQMMYENLPIFLQPGVVVWNKTSIELANNCRAISSATSSSSIRGLSLSCVRGDTMVEIRENGWRRRIRVDELYAYHPNKLSPDSTSLTDPDCSIEVLSEDNTFRKFRGVSRTLVYGIIDVGFSDGTTLSLTPEHPVYVDGEYVSAGKLSLGTRVRTGSGYKWVETKSYSSVSKYVYDLVDVEVTHNFFANDTLIHNCIYLDEMAFVRNDVEFFTSTYPVISSGKKSRVIITSTPNGMNLFYRLWTDALEGKNDFSPIKFTWRDHPNRDEEWKRKTLKILGPEAFAQEHEGEFMGSSGTLISGQKLKTLTYTDPVREVSPHYKEYHSPVKGRTYVACVDVSEGVGGDYSVCTIVDVTDQPFRVSAVYRDNTVAPDAMAEVIFPILRAYNNPYCVIETNGVGVIVGDNLLHELEYDNILMSESKNGKVLPSSKSKSTTGIRQTKSTKKIGCSRLKQLIESDSLIINDYDLLQELYSFSRRGSSYEAEKGKNDDIVMTLVLFGWLVEQEMFSELTSDNIKKLLRQQYVDTQYGEDLDFGFCVDGTEDPYFDEEFHRVVNHTPISLFSDSPDTQFATHF